MGLSAAMQNRVENILRDLGFSDEKISELIREEADRLSERLSNSSLASMLPSILGYTPGLFELKARIASEYRNALLLQGFTESDAARIVAHDAAINRIGPSL